jgi:hypothetical protein
MASGDVTNEYDERLSGSVGRKPVCGLTLEMVVANNTSEKEEELDEAERSCMNCLLTGLCFEAPLLATANKTIKLELLTERDNVIYSTGDLDATSAVDHPIHLQRALMGKTVFKITCDANVGSDKTFFVEMRGL